jgi:hypothetical protein
MTLASPEVLEDGVVWLRYRLQNHRCAAADAGSHRPPPERFRDGSRTESLERAANWAEPSFFRARGPLGKGGRSQFWSLFDDPLRAATERVGAIVTGNGGDKPAAEVIELNRR